MKLKPTDLLFQYTATLDSGMGDSYTKTIPNSLGHKILEKNPKRIHHDYFHSKYIAFYKGNFIVYEKYNGELDTPTDYEIISINYGLLALFKYILYNLKILK